MPSEVRFVELRKKLEQHGWTLNRITGSHYIFEKRGEEFHITIPVHKGQVKPGYARRIEQRLGGKKR